MFKTSLLIFGGTLFLNVLVSLPVNAQTALTGPALGFIFDPHGQALRPIQGIPGAALFGDPVGFSSPVASAAVSLHHTVAIVDNGSWQVMLVNSSGVTTVGLPDGLPDNAQVVLSETGDAAAFYDTGNAALTVVTGILTSNFVISPVSLDSLPGAVTHFAPADDGSVLLTASVAGSGESLVWLGHDGSVNQLANLQKTASLLVWNHGASALVVDHDANQIWKLQNPGGTAALALAASSGDGVAGPTGAALSADGRLLWIANTDAHSVLGVDLTSRATQSIACSVDPAAMLPLADGQTYRLNDLDNGPVWVLDTAPGSGPRVVFIPAIPAALSEVGQ